MVIFTNILIITALNGELRIVLQKYIEEKELTKQIVKILKDIELPDEFHKWAMIQVIKLD